MATVGQIHTKHKWLTQDFLREVFTYNEETGELVFLPKDPVSQENRRWNTRYAGKAAGSPNDGGYLHVKLKGFKLKIHRLVFLFHHGWLPEKVDHEDGDTLNNRVWNLRPATSSENNQNSRTGTNNTSGVKGVSWHKQHKKWYATIQSNGKSKFLGLFTDKSDAKGVVRREREKRHGEFANHG